MISKSKSITQNHKLAQFHYWIEIGLTNWKGQIHKKKNYSGLGLKLINFTHMERGTPRTYGNYLKEVGEMPKNNLKLMRYKGFEWSRRRKGVYFNFKEIKSCADLV